MNNQVTEFIDTGHLMERFYRLIISPRTESTVDREKRLQSLRKSLTKTQNFRLEY